MAASLGISKLGSAFFVLSILKNTLRFRQFWFYLMKLKSERNWYLYLRWYWQHKSSRPHFEMPGLGEYCGYYFKNHTCESRCDDWMSQINSDFKDDISFVLQMSWFVWPPEVSVMVASFSYLYVKSILEALRGYKVFSATPWWDFPSQYWIDPKFIVQ